MNDTRCSCKKQNAYRCAVDLNLSTITCDCTCHRSQTLTHTLKINSQQFTEVNLGIKTAEFRWNDKNFQQGDKMLLCEWDQEEEVFTGQKIKTVITCITTGFGIPDGYVMLSFKTLL